MYTDNYIHKKLESMSPVEKHLSEEIAIKLGEWATIKETAAYLKKHRNTIYNRVKEGSVISRKVGTHILIYTKSLIFLLEDE